MKQMTIRSFDPELEKAMEEMGRKRQWSLNQVAIYLMRKGLCLTNEAESQPIGNQLDEFFGVWSMQEASEFDVQVDEAFGGIDEENWR